MSILQQVSLCVIFSFLFLIQSVDNWEGDLFRTPDPLDENQLVGRIVGGDSPDRNELVGRIVGGMGVPITHTPYQVSLQRHGVHFCGGALITRQHVVTAAHCTYDGKSQRFIHPSELSIRIGSTFRDHSGLVDYVQSVIPHPYFNRHTVDYDIAVLKLTYPLPVNEYITPIPLASQSANWPPGTRALISGWGVDQVRMSSNALPRNLNAVFTKIIDNQICRSLYYPMHTITDRMICAGEVAGGKDACQGDSGGPLVIDGVLAGVVSFGTGCARPGVPGVYSSVPVLRGFIEHAVMFN